MSDDLAATIAEVTASLADELIAFRRDLHAHPETSNNEIRTTAKVAERLTQDGLQPQLLAGTGLICDLGPTAGADGTELKRVAIRGDMDALPIDDLCDLPWRSKNPGAAHACGHDVHTTVTLGAGLVLHELNQRGLLRQPVRLIFQPAEETMSGGGAFALLRQHVLDGVERIAAVHCEPKIDVGQIGTRIGPITSASDDVTVTISASGGHTSRPHLTGDVVFALGEVITQVPAVLGRRLDPRSGVNLTWGMVHAGDAHNAIPSVGSVGGTMRCLDSRAWEHAGQVLDEAVCQVIAPYAVDVAVEHTRGVPPVDNDRDVTLELERVARGIVGSENLLHMEQSLGGEDFAWYLTKVPGSMARLGTGSPDRPRSDLHQGNLVIDEGAIPIGVRLLAGFAAGAE